MHQEREEISGCRKTGGIGKGIIDTVIKKKLLQFCEFGNSYILRMTDIVARISFFIRHSVFLNSF